MAKIYILLPVHNRREITRKFIECLISQTISDFRLVLIDDGSADGTSDMVREYISSAILLSGSGTWWWAGSLQRGINWLKTQEIGNDALVLFINDDVQFATDYLERAIRIMADKKGVLMLSSYMHPESGEISESGVTADLKKLTFTEASSSEQINCLSTRGLFVHWGDAQLIGDFHPSMLPHYLSDYEYTMRAYRKGLKLKTSADLYILENPETTGYHVIEDRYFRDFVKKYFSIKSVSNPFYWSSFVILTCSPLWLIVNLVKIWARAAKDLGRALFAAVRRS